MPFALRVQTTFWNAVGRLHNLQFRSEQLASQRPSSRWLLPLIRLLRLPQWRLHSSLQDEARPAEILLRRHNSDYAFDPATPCDNELGQVARDEIQDPLVAEECLLHFQTPLAIDPSSFALVRDRHVLLKNACFVGTSAPYRHFPDLSYTRFRIAHLQARKIPRAIFFHYCWSTNYYHLHMEVLSMLRVLDEFPQFKPWPLLTHPALWKMPLFQAVLQRIGLQHASWIVPAGHECLEVGELIVARGNAMTRPGLAHFQQLLHLQGNPAVNRQIYLKRAPGTIRPLKNQSEICDFLRARNFEIIDAGPMSYAEQTTLFSECRWLVAEHGAGMTNMLYRLGAPLSVLELFPPNPTAHGCYYRLAQGMGATHHSLPGTLHPEEENAYTIPLDRLDQALSRLLQEN